MAEKAHAELETVSLGEVERSTTQKLDKHGLPLVPQPSDFRDDPLNWSPAVKLLITLQVSWLAFLGPMGAATVNPAYVPLGKAFGITTVQASYQLMVYILCAGVGPLLTVPFANVYGRRPIYLFGNLLAGITNVLAGSSATWSGVMVTRVFNGVGAGTSVALGGATIVDLYHLHERGLYMGIYTFFLTNGPHLAPLIGGFLAQNLNWRWCFYVPAFMQLAAFLFTVFFLPETLFSRRAPESHVERSRAQLLLFRRPQVQKRRLTLFDFVRPFFMLRYLSILLPALYYMTCFSYGSVLYAATGAALFRQYYGFDTVQTGLMLSVPLLIGCLIGEANAGWFTDWLVLRRAKKHNGERTPEPRLDALWLALLLPVGCVIEGVSLSNSPSWVGAAVGMGISCFGLQVATTVCYAYCTDCYKPQSAEISSQLNVFRQVCAAFVSFYAVPLAERIQVQYAWLVFALINTVLLLPMALLRIYGGQWRNSSWQAPPKFHNDI